MRTTIVTLCTVMLLSRAHAQSPASTAAEAEFTKGRQLIADGKVAEACAAFEHSQKIDPQLGTLFNLAGCYERLGKKASAWTAYREVAQRDTNATRKAQATDAATRLFPQLAHVRLEPSSTPGVSVTLDGVDITSTIGIEMPIDRGQFQLVVKAPGYKPWTGNLVVADDGKPVTQLLPALVKDPVHVDVEPAKPAEPVAACFPSCRDGFTCRAGRCEATTHVDVSRPGEPTVEPTGPPRFQAGVMFGLPSVLAGEQQMPSPPPADGTHLVGKQETHIGARFLIQERGSLWLALEAAFAVSHQVNYFAGAYQPESIWGAEFAVEQVVRIPLGRPSWSLLLDRELAIDLDAGGFYTVNMDDAGVLACARLSYFWFDIGPRASYGTQSGFNAGLTTGARVAF